MKTLSHKTWYYIANNLIYANYFYDSLNGGSSYWYVALYRDPKNRLMLATSMNVELASGDQPVWEEIHSIDDNPELYALLDMGNYQFVEDEMLDFLLHCEIETVEHEEKCKPFVGWQWDFIAGSVDGSQTQLPTATK